MVERGVRVVVDVGRADERAAEPRQGEDRAPAAAGTIAPPTSGTFSGASVMCLPRLGAMRGNLGLVVQLLGAQRSAQTPVALTTLSAATTSSSPVSPSRARPHALRAAGLLDELGDLEAVGADGAEALGLGQTVRTRRESSVWHRRRGSPTWARARRARAAARAPRRRDDPVAVGAPRVVAAAAQALPGHDVVEFRPTPTSRSGRPPSKAGTTSGSGLTRCGASAVSSWRSSSASRTRPRSKFCR